MSYVSLEDDFHSNPKVLAAGLDGTGLYARGLSYCGAHLTDGFLPRAWVMGATEGKRAPIKKCVSAGLIAEVTGGYIIRDYLEHNPSKVQVLERRAERSESGKKGARSRWVGREKSQGSSDSNSDDTSDSSSHSDSHSSDLANGWHSTPTSVEAKASTSKPRKPDPLWDVLAAELGDPQTKSERGRRNAALKELREIGATPDAVRQRIAWWAANWGDVTCTASGLAANWTTLGNGSILSPKIGEPGFVPLTGADQQEHRRLIEEQRRA